MDSSDAGARKGKIIYQVALLLGASIFLLIILPKPPDFILQYTEFPEFLPPYRDLFFDPARNIWVHVNVNSRASNVFDVFSPKGEFNRQITLERAPIDETFASSLGKCFVESGLWRIERGEEGYASLVKYRLVPGK